MYKHIIGEMEDIRKHKSASQVGCNSFPSEYCTRQEVNFILNAC